MAKIHPAIAEHVMQESERLSEALRRIADLPIDRCITENDYRLSAAKAIALAALSQQAESTPAAVPDSSDTFYAGLYKKSAPMWHRLHDLAVSKGYDHVRFAIECAPVYRCDCMGARKVAIDMAGNTIPCECVAAANEAEPVRCEHCDGTGDVHRADGEWLGECKECDAAEPAPVQDEREMGELRIRLENGRRQFEFEEYDAAYSLPAGTHYLYTRPVQTEQQPTVKDCLTVQPMAYAVFADNGNVACFSTQRDHPSLVMLEKEGHSVVSLAPIAQTAQGDDQ